jgi:hypothetical protein
VGDEAPDTSAASAPSPGASAPAANETDSIIEEIAAQAQAARLKELDARQPTKPAPAETKAEPAEAADDDDDPEPEPAKPAAKKAPAEADGDYADVDSLSAAERLEQAAAALKAGDLKKALRLTLKTNPEALKVDAGKFAAFRQAQRREQQKSAARTAEKEAALAAREQSFTERETQLTQRDQTARAEIQQWIERLKPYEVYYQAEQAWKNDGDPKHLVKLIEGLTGKPYNDAQAIILRSEKQDPRLSRMQAEMDRQRAEHQRLLQQLEQSRQAEEQRRQAEEQARQQQTAVQARANDLAEIRKQLSGHDVAKLPRFEERVYRVLEKHVDPKLGLQITVAQAAERVLRAERKRIESSPFYKPAPPPPEATAPAPKAPAVRPPLRRESQNNGAAVGDESTDDIIADIAAQAQRARMTTGGKAR